MFCYRCSFYFLLTGAHNFVQEYIGAPVNKMSTCKKIFSTCEQKSIFRLCKQSGIASQYRKGKLSVQRGGFIIQNFFRWGNTRGGDGWGVFRIITPGPIIPQTNVVPTELCRLG